ncbi:hypothetical protein HYW18_00025 [Candidatus Uhrbacteria bacterium]|nr:hypothetical protein [Candidatus Uhrbacteria bacterium]
MPAKKKVKKPLMTYPDVPHMHTDPLAPLLPTMPEPPKPLEPGICAHCHLLPASAYELVVVFLCLVFSLSAVLLTSVQLIEDQQAVIAALEKVKTTVYAQR